MTSQMKTSIEFGRVPCARVSDSAELGSVVLLMWRCVHLSDEKLSELRDLGFLWIHHHISMIDY